MTRAWGYPPAWRRAATQSVYRDGVPTGWTPRGYREISLWRSPCPVQRPKPDSKRRRSAKPKSYGDATPTTAPAAARASTRELGIDGAHPLIASIWDTVQESCEAAFYSDCDWVRLRLELWHANREMASSRPSAQAWTAVQHGLSELLLSPAVKRRAGIEVRPQSVDADEVAAVSIVGRYRHALKSV
jgi:hypothetical protein